MSDSEFLLPVYHNKHSSSIMRFFRKNAFYKLNVSLPKIGWTSVTLSFISFSFCILWSIIYNFEEANATHCSVENFFPSISAAIGHFYPQIYVWNTSVIAQMIPRLKISTMYLHYYSSIIHDKYLRFCYAAWVLHVCELWALLGLSIITSTSNYSE
ncbi:hypothetical protein RUM44_014041 [Polyplax serrata]|uniref:CWH43-like N-terminal domain-containing protein n=1 Tax=Polyplax serrata TaxID=468196 RepID=A0ABR1BFU8_POLSC